MWWRHSRAELQSPALAPDAEVGAASADIDAEELEVGSCPYRDVRAQGLAEQPLEVGWPAVVRPTPPSPTELLPSKMGVFAKRWQVWRFRHVRTRELMLAASERRLFRRSISSLARSCPAPAWRHQDITPLP